MLRSKDEVERVAKKYLPHASEKELDIEVRRIMYEEWCCYESDISLCEHLGITLEELNKWRLGE